MLEGEEVNLRILVHPELHTVVTDEDLPYLESLFKDFIYRAKTHPSALFEQVSSLGVGLLVTQVVGTRISDHPPLLELRSRFVQL